MMLTPFWAEAVASEMDDKGDEDGGDHGNGDHTDPRNRPGRSLQDERRDAGTLHARDLVVAALAMDEQAVAIHPVRHTGDESEQVAALLDCE